MKFHVAALDAVRGARLAMEQATRTPSRCCLGLLYSQVDGHGGGDRHASEAYSQRVAPWIQISNAACVEGVHLQGLLMHKMQRACVPGMSPSRMLIMPSSGPAS